MPITLIVLLLSIIIAPMSTGTILMFIVGAVLLIVGMGFFTLGADMSMTPLGEKLGNELAKSRKPWFIAFVGFLMGMIITIAEPDLQVLANQVPAIDNMVLILTVAVGVGIFLVVAIFRILLRVSLSKILLVLYIAVFVLSFFVPNEFVSVAFDSGGVTTGPITVPFIMALGVGLAYARGDKDSADDSFGLVALSSVGPIIAVLVLGIIYNPEDAVYVSTPPVEVDTSRDVAAQFLTEFPAYFKEVALAVLPIIMLMIIFQIICKRYTKRQLIRSLIGFLYAFIGLTLFLTGVNVGFIPVGLLIGSEIASKAYNWILVPIGMVIGYFIVTAEPAVHVLNKQVEEVTEGTIPTRAMNTTLAIGMAISLGLSMIRTLTGISIYWFVLPGYAIAFILSYFVPKIFVGIAFDSGGVASGPMTSTFLLPFAIGACEASGGNVMTDAFGVVAMVAMTPLIAVQIMGILYNIKLKKAAAEEDTIELDDSDDDIIEYEEEPSNE